MSNRLLFNLQSQEYLNLLPPRTLNYEEYNNVLQLYLCSKKAKIYQSKYAKWSSEAKNFDSKTMIEVLVGFVESQSMTVLDKSIDKMKKYFDNQIYIYKLGFDRDSSRSFTQCIEKVLYAILITKSIKTLAIRDQESVTKCKKMLETLAAPIFESLLFGLNICVSKYDSMNQAFVWLLKITDNLNDHLL